MIGDGHARHGDALREIGLRGACGVKFFLRRGIGAFGLNQFTDIALARPDDRQQPFGQRLFSAHPSVGIDHLARDVLGLDLAAGDASAAFGRQGVQPLIDVRHHMRIDQQHGLIVDDRIIGSGRVERRRHDQAAGRPQLAAQRQLLALHLRNGTLIEIIGDRIAIGDARPIGGGRGRRIVHRGRDWLLDIEGVHFLDPAMRRAIACDQCQ